MPIPFARLVPDVVATGDKELPVGVVDQMAGEM
jgi:hypothetical protein